MVDDDNILLTADEAKVKLREAVFKTKGKCNSEFALDIAMRKASTVDDIIRLATEAEVPLNYRKALRGSLRNHRTTVSYRINEKRRVALKDTVVWRWIEKMGLVKMAEAQSLHTMTLSTNRMSNMYQEALEGLMMYGRAGVNMDDLHRHIVDALKRVKMKYGENYDEDIKKFVGMELKWLANMPDSLNDWVENYDLTTLTQAVWNSNGHQNYHNRFSSYYAEKGEIARMKSMAMAEYLEYMGIGVIGVYAYNSSATRRKGIMPMTKFVMSAQNKFMSMIKKGFEVSLVREEICSMLSTWAETHCSIRWKFYPRTDAPTEYPELVVKKVKRLGHSGSASPTIVKLEGDAVKTFTTDEGKTITFDLGEAQ